MESHLSVAIGLPVVVHWSRNEDWLSVIGMLIESNWLPHQCILAREGSKCQFRSRYQPVIPCDGLSNIGSIR